MASILDSVTRGAHNTAKALIDNNIPTKFGDIVTTAMTSGFSLIADGLKIVVDLTAPPASPSA